MSFEWRTDEDKGWQEEARSEGTAVAPFWRRRWPFFVVILLGLATVWGAVQWQIGQRINTTTEEISAEILNTHNFVLQTAVNQDEALFRANLSGRDPEWLEVQKALLNEGWLLNRPILGWQNKARVNELTLDDVTLALSPDLQAAELIYPQIYQVEAGDGATKRVTLQQTAVYRQGSSRWLYAPPLEEFWGDWVSQDGAYLTMVYPERDQEVAVRLAVALDALLAQLCAELDELNCDRDLRVHLRLDPSPDSLLPNTVGRTLLRGGLRLELPAPTLVGLPVDEAGYEFLYQAYGVQLATAVLAHQVDYNCCGHVLFFWALRDYQLAQLGLQPWPLENAQFTETLWARFDGDALGYWARRWLEAPPQFVQASATEESQMIWQRVYSLIEFLAMQETAVSPTEMMRLLDGNSYYEWLDDVLAGTYEEDFFATHFLDYIYQQTVAEQQGDRPIPLPEGTITLVCSEVAGSARTENMYTYDLVSNRWTELFPDLDLDGYVSFADGKNFVLTEYDLNSFGQSISNHYWLRDGELQLLEQFTPRQNEEHLVNYYFWEQMPSYIMRYENHEGKFSVSLRSLECPMNGCPELQLEGLPVVSPNSRFLLDQVLPISIVGPYAELQSDLFLISVDEETRQPIGKGGEAFWIDDNAYGFVRLNEAGWELVTAVMPQNQPRVLLYHGELLAELPEDDRPVGVLFAQIKVNPQFPQQLLLQLETTQPESYLFDLRLTPDFTAVERVELLHTHTIGRSYFSFSPDGRYIIVRTYNSANGEAAISLLDQETGEHKGPLEVGLFGFSWTPDSQWFVQHSENYVRFYAPAYDYYHYIPHGIENCQQLFLSVDE